MSKATAHIYTTIKDKVLNMEFGIDRHINSLELATQLGVSRTIVREALLQLSAEEIIVQKPRKGFYTHNACPEQIRHLLELRLAIESMTVQLAAQRGTDTQLQELLTYAQQTVRYAPPEYSLMEMIHYDEKFHMDIAVIAGNTEMVKQLQRVNQRIRLTRWSNSKTITLPARKQHIYIAEVLLQRNAKKALRHMTKHIQNRITTIQHDLSQRVLWHFTPTPPIAIRRVT